MSLPEKLDEREQHFRIPGENGLTLFLRYLGPAGNSGGEKIVLYIHGATFPSALSIAHRFDGRSWRDELNAAGFHVWALDFQGFGSSDHFAEMSESAEGRPPLGRAESASRQLEKAVRFVAAQHGVARISLIAHSWGSMAAGLFSGRRPELVERLVFFAPIALGPPPQSRAQRYGGWQLVSLQQQWERFIEDVPAGEPPVLSRRHFEDWGPRYLATDAESGTRSPQSVKVPCGPVQEISEAQAGRLAYDPGAIRAPVAILRGEWDHLVTDCHAHWLFNALRNSALKRDIKISRGTHLLHLEAGRYALYRETQAFLDGQDQAPTTTERNNSKE